MKFLLCNDDGIDAPGLRTLREIALGFGEPVVVAPGGPQSGASHTITFDGPLALEDRGDQRYALFGTPADCARVGLNRVAPDTNWILSGINYGGNLGADVYYSGTVGAVREAGLHGWPGIAFSHRLRSDREIDWKRAGRWVAQLLPQLLARPVEAGLFYNVNLPHLIADEPEPEVIFCPLDPHPLPLSYRHEEGGQLFYDADYNARQSHPGTDVDVCFHGNIAVTEMRLF